MTPTHLTEQGRPAGAHAYLSEYMINYEEAEVVNTVSFISIISGDPQKLVKWYWSTSVKLEMGGEKTLYNYRDKSDDAVFSILTGCGTNACLHQPLPGLLLELWVMDMPLSCPVFQVGVMCQSSSLPPCCAHTRLHLTSSLSFHTLTLTAENKLYQKERWHLRTPSPNLLPLLCHQLPSPPDCRTLDVSLRRPWGGNGLAV